MNNFIRVLRVLISAAMLVMVYGIYKEEQLFGMNPYVAILILTLIQFFFLYRQEYQKIKRRRSKS